MLDDWVTDLRMRASSWSTVRGYQGAIRRFCWFITDPAYSWSVDCERIFGTHPVQVCQDGNMMVHVAETESVPAKRAFAVEELQTFLHYADAQVQTAHRRPGCPHRATPEGPSFKGSHRFAGGLCAWAVGRLKAARA